MSWLIGNWVHLGAVAGKATLMFATALFALRLGERRTLAQWTVVDFVAAAAIGTIVGRTSVAAPQSFITGAVALVTLIALHRAASLLRFQPLFRRITDHRVRVLVAYGEIQRDQLPICGLTESDLAAHLREQGVFDLSDVRFVLYESKGGLTVISRDGPGSPLPALVREGLQDAVNPPREGTGPAVS